MHRRWVAALALALVSCTRTPPAPYRISAVDPATLRHPPAGDVIGGAGRYDSVAWLGIPYAAPPVGTLRWRSPVPAPRWSTPREALAFGAACPQYGSRFGGAPGVRPGDVGGDEDCLTLNVWAPPDARPGDRLPVFFWIHGGGDTIGHAGLFDGGHLAVGERLIVVTVQYRLGPFGFFRHPALRAGAADPVDASGNFGLLDLVRALAWVRDNASAFGGNPDNVTIAGESAGGMNVCALLVAPPARGLFHRAVVQSGGFWFDDAATADRPPGETPTAGTQTPQDAALRLMEREAGTADDAAARARLAAMPPADVAAWLRGRPTHALLGAYTPQPTGMIEMPRIVRDGAVVPTDDPFARLARPEGWNRVPVLVGTNRDENKLFMFAQPELIRMRFWIVPRFVDEASYELSSDYLARLWKAGGADAPATAMARSDTPAFVYRFDWREEPTILGADLSKMLGASHAFEIPFVFGHFDLGREASRLFTRDNEPGRLALSRAMMSYWAGFARTGTPAGADLPTWERWGDGRTLVLDTPRGGGIRTVAGVETRERILAELAADPRLPTPAARCRMLRVLAAWGHGMTRADYEQRSDCTAFPFDGFPWPDRG